MGSILHPTELVKKLPIWEGMTIADLGCGSGIFTIELAKALNGSGKIVAFDIQEKSLSFLNERANYNNVGHLIETKLSDLDSKNFASGLTNTFDMVTVINLLFQIENKQKIIADSKKILKPGGFLVIVDWEVFKIPNNENLYPVKQPDLLNMIQSDGFSIKETFRPSNTHFGLILIKN